MLSGRLFKGKTISRWAVSALCAFGAWGGVSVHAQIPDIPVIPGMSSKVDNANFSCTFPSGWMVLSIPGMPSSDSTGIALDTAQGGVFMVIDKDNGDVDPSQIPDGAADQIPTGSTTKLISTSSKKIGSYTWSISVWEWTNEKGEKYRGNVYFSRVKSGAYMSVVAVPDEPRVEIAELVADAEAALATLVVKGGSAIQATLKNHAPAQRPTHSWSVDVMGRVQVEGKVFRNPRLAWLP